MNHHPRFIPIMTDPRLPYRADNKDLESTVAIIRRISDRRIDPRCRLCLPLHWIFRLTEISNLCRNQSTLILAGGHSPCSLLPSPLDRVMVPLPHILPQGQNLLLSRITRSSPRCLMDTICPYLLRHPPRTLNTQGRERVS